MRGILTILAGILLAFGGWIGGSVYPAPQDLIARLKPDAILARMQHDLGQVDLSALQQTLNPDQFDAFIANATRIATDAGHAIMIDHASDADTSEAEHAATAAMAPQGPAAPATAGDAGLLLCPRMTVSNAPKSDTSGRVLAYSPKMNVNGVALALDPTRDTCLSSGFGTRGAKLHKGIDFYNPAGGVVTAAGDGTIVEMKYRDDYGNMLLIDHGQGVYTRYSHLSAFTRGLKAGAKVSAGDQIGLMGNTAAFPIPIHLHYEVLTGDYNNPKQSFGLTPRNPFELAKAG